MKKHPTVIVKNNSDEVVLELAIGYAGPCTWPSYVDTPLVLQALRDAITMIEATVLSGPRVAVR